MGWRGRCPGPWCTPRNLGSPARTHTLLSVGVQNPPLHKLCDFHGPCRPACNNVHIIKRSKKEKSIFSLQQSSNHQKITEIRISSPNLQYPSLNQPVRGSKEQGSSSPPNMFFWFMAKLLQTNKSRNNKWSREVKHKSIGMSCSYPYSVISLC